MIYLCEKDEKIEIGKVEEGILIKSTKFSLSDSAKILQTLIEFGTMVCNCELSSKDGFALFGSVDYFDIDGVTYRLNKYLDLRQNYYIKNGFIKEKISEWSLYRMSSIAELLEYEKRINKKTFTQKEIRQFYYEAKWLAEHLSPFTYGNDVYRKAGKFFYDLKILFYNLGCDVPVRLLEKATEYAVTEEVKVLSITAENLEKLVYNKNGLTIKNLTENKKILEFLK